MEFLNRNFDIFRVPVLCYNKKIELYRKKYNNMMSDFILEKEIKTLIPERFKGKREKENVEIISKEDFLKELQVIVTAYENIYNDSGIQEMFEKYKKKLSFK